MSYRRRASLPRTFWVYRRLIALAMLLGLILWFIVINRQAVTVYFPFGLGKIDSSTGIVILLSAFAGSVVTALTTGLILTIRRHRHPEGTPLFGKPDPLADLPEDRPPPDYAVKTTEGFPDSPRPGR
jgi:uncharacterized integral membrane protein